MLAPPDWARNSRAFATFCQVRNFRFRLLNAGTEFLSLVFWERIVLTRVPTGLLGMCAESGVPYAFSRSLDILSIPPMLWIGLGLIINGSGILHGVAMGADEKAKGKKTEEIAISKKDRERMARDMLGSEIDRLTGHGCWSGACMRLGREPEEKEPKQPEPERKKQKVR